MPDYTARVELDSRDFDGAHTDTLMDLVEPYDGAVSRSLAGRVELLFTVPAIDLRQAASTALAVAQSFGHTAATLEVLASAEFHARGLAIPVPDLLSVSEAAEALDVSAQRVRQLLEDGKLAGAKVGATWTVLRSAVEQRAGTAVRHAGPTTVTAYVSSPSA